MSDAILDVDVRSFMILISKGQVIKMHIILVISANHNTADYSLGHIEQHWKVTYTSYKMAPPMVPRPLSSKLDFSD